MNPLSKRRYYRSLSPLISPGLLPQGLDATLLFGREAPLELEIGFGNGEYLSRHSLKFPERDFIGVEIAWPSVKRALRRLGAPPRENVRIVCLPAWPVLKKLFKEESLTVVRALYPVPWPKHPSKRLFSQGFLNLIASRLKADGIFHMVTDDLELAKWTMEEGEGSALSLTLSEEGSILNTKYERKWEESGKLRFYHLKGRKTTEPHIPKPYGGPMKPHYLKDLEPSSYRPRGANGDITVVFREFIFDGDKRQGLLNCKVVEDSFVQEFFIRVKEVEDGLWKLYPALSERVFPTEGVELSLKLAALEET
ncbi:MAG: hypothetical protein LBE27_03385 [Deltaproteobacteria bacterium]|jgi:tRNA (guanine-N7-)-methyltransferase|nr:hypothetical protein [Deltaproteobacteria bacterium]